MTAQRKIKFSADLCTFYAPAFWADGSEPDGELRDLFAAGRWSPLRFWERILDSAQAAGLDGIEITFAPGNWQSALAAYGSAAGFSAAVTAHKLEISGGFFSSTDPDTGKPLRYDEAADHDRVVALGTAYAEFLAGCGSTLMIASLPLRANRLDDPPRIVDLAYATTIANLLNRLGAATLRQGVRLVIHPEAFTVFRNSRDADLFMLLTDPTYVGLCPDTAQFTVAGSDPIEIAGRHRDRVLLTHFKDAVGPAPLDVPIDETIWGRQVQWFAAVGTGVVDWPRWMRLLREIGYEGWAVYELDNAPDPVGALQEINRFVEGALLHIYR